MQDEEIFIGGYILRRDDDDDDSFTIESSLNGRVLRVSEEKLTMKIGELWKELGE